MSHQFCVVLAVVMLVGATSAQAAFYVTRSGRIAVIEHDIAYRIETDRGRTLESVLEDPGGWVLQRAVPFVTDGSPVHLWARAELPRVSAPQRVLVLAPGWEEAEYFFLREGKLVGHARGGGLLPWSQRTLRVSTTTMGMTGGWAEIELLPGQPTVVLARLATTHRFYRIDRLGFTVWNATRVREGERKNLLLQGLVLGVMAFLILYNLGLFAVIREPAHLYYAVMETGFTATWFVAFGIGFEYLWPDRPAWDFPAAWLLTILGGTGLYQFLRHYLETWRHFPRLDTVLKGLLIVQLCVMPAVLLPTVSFEQLILVLVYGAPLAAALVLAIVFAAWRSRHPLSRNLMLAMGCMMTGIVIAALGVLQLIPMSDFVAHAGQIGSVLAGAVFSLGLGYRMQAIRDELAQRELAEQRLRLAHERATRALVEEQNRTLETRVEQRTAELAAAREKAEGLLANILPRAIIEELNAKGITEPKRHEEVSILFTDFSGFVETVASIPAKRLVEELDDIFRAFDQISGEHGLEKIKTIGDSYMAASGLPMPAADHAKRCVRTGLALTRYIEERNRNSALKWNLRVGIHSGAVVAGVVGQKKYAYDIWGDTVNLASRLESASERNRVNISAYTYELVRDRFECEYREKLHAKGKGEIDMYFVLCEKP